MGTINDKLEYLMETRIEIINALTDSGIQVPNNATFRDLANLIYNMDPMSQLNLQEGSVSPDGGSTTVYPDNGYDAFSSVTVTGDSNLSSENIRNGVTIYGVTGTFVSEDALLPGDGVNPNVTNLESGTVTPTGQMFMVSPSEGYTGFSDITVMGDENLVPENVVTGATIYGVVGTGKGAGNLKETMITPNGSMFTVYAADRKCDGFSSVTITGDTELIPENIIAGKCIYGVTGIVVRPSGKNAAGMPIYYDIEDKIEDVEFVESIELVE